MGERGPAKTPTAVKRARGSKGAKYDNPDEPQPAAGRPTMPRGLPDRAKTVWRQTVAILEGMKLLSRAEAQPLARYCHAVVAAADAAEGMAKNGVTVDVTKTFANGTTEERREKNPDVELFARMSEVCLKLEVQFGLTPAARTKIKVESTPKRPVGRPPGSKKDRQQAAKTKTSSGPKLRVVGE